MIISILDFYSIIYNNRIVNTTVTIVLSVVWKWVVCKQHKTAFFEQRFKIITYTRAPGLGGGLIFSGT